MGQPEIPPACASSSRTVDASAWASNGPGQAARRFGWSGPGGEEFAPDKSASALLLQRQAEPLALSVSGVLRRNVLGAIALVTRTMQLPEAKRRRPGRITNE